MTHSEILKIFESCGAFISNGHFVYTSGKHGSQYVNKDAIYPHTERVSLLCSEIASKVSAWSPEVVIGPALGGIILSQWVAHHLSSCLQKEVLSVYAEKKSSSNEPCFQIVRGYDDLIQNRKVLVVEDILTSGVSVSNVVQTVRGHGATVVGVAALCNRGGIEPKELGVPQLFSLMNLTLDSYPPEECQLCKTGIPISRKLGKGKTQI